MTEFENINRRQYLTAAATAGTIPTGSNFIEFRSEVEVDTYIYVNENGTMYLDVYVERGWRHMTSRADPEDFEIDEPNATVETISDSEFHVDGIPWNEPERVEPGTFDYLSEVANEELAANDTEDTRSAKDSIDRLQGRAESAHSLVEFSPQLDQYTHRYQKRIDNAVTVDESAEWPIYTIPQIKYPDKMALDNIDSEKVHIRFPDGVVYDFSSNHTRPESMKGEAMSDENDDFLQLPTENNNGTTPDFELTNDTWGQPPTKEDNEVVPEFEHTSNPVFGTIQSSASTRANIHEMVLQIVDDSRSIEEIGDDLSTEAVNTLLVLIPGRTQTTIFTLGGPFAIMAGMAIGKFSVITGATLLILTDGIETGIDMADVMTDFDEHFERGRFDPTEIIFIGDKKEHSIHDKRGDVEKHLERADYLSKHIIPSITSGREQNHQSVAKDLAKVMDSSDISGGVNNVEEQPARTLRHQNTDQFDEVVRVYPPTDDTEDVDIINRLTKQTPKMFASEHRIIDAFANPDKYSDDEQTTPHPESGEYSITEFRGDMSNTGQRAENALTEINNIRWDVETPQGPSTPLVTDDYLVALFESGPTIQVRDRDTGNIVWERSFEDEAGLVQTPYVGAVPVVTDDRIVFALDGDVIAFDLHIGGETDQDGKIQPIWRTEIHDLGREDLARTLTISDGVVYLTGDESNIIALTLESGEKVWEASTNGTDMSPTSPAVNENTVYAILDGGLYAFNKIDGTEEWHDTNYDLGGDAVVVAEDTVIALEKDQWDTETNVVVHGFDTDSGTHEWAIETEANDAYAPVVYDGELYLIADDGFLGYNGALGRLSPETEEVHHIYNFQRGTRGPPTIADGIAYMVEKRTGSLYAVDLENEEVLWRQRLDINIESGSVTLKDGVLYCGTNTSSSGQSRFSLTNDHIIAFE